MAYCMCWGLPTPSAAPDGWAAFVGRAVMDVCARVLCAPVLCIACVVASMLSGDRVSVHGT